MARRNKRQAKPMGNASTRKVEATQAITERNATESRFLNLSPEFRNRVYRFAFGDRTIHIWANWRLRHTVCHGDEQDDSKLELANVPLYAHADRKRLTDHCVGEKSDCLSLRLLRTCRQICAEAALIPLTTNEFRVHSTVLGRFEDTLRAFQKRSIKKLTLFCASHTYYFTNGAVQKFKGLEELKVIAIHPRHRTPNIGGIESFAGLPLQRVSIIERAQGIGDVESSNHADICTRLIEAGKKNQGLEEMREKAKTERAESSREQSKKLLGELNEEARQALQKPDGLSARAQRRLKRSVIEMLD